MQIIRISPRGFGANTYVLTEDNQTAVVIDPAQPRVESELIKLGLKAEYVLLTHCHFDHVHGAYPLQQAGAKVLCTDKEKPLFGTAADLYEMFGAARTPLRIDDVLKEDETRTLCGIEIKTLLTPGHTQGSASYLVTTKDGGRYLFTGDTLFAGTVGRTDFPTGDVATLRASLKRLSALEENLPVYAGHEEETDLETERKNNPFLLDL